jgi:hypothetical protein
MGDGQGKLELDFWPQTARDAPPKSFLQMINELPNLKKSTNRQ